VLIRNNILSGTRNADENRNGSSIMLYTSSHITIENNDISDTSNGIFIKGNNSGPVTIRYNYIHDIDKEGIAIGGLGTETEKYGGQIYQNIIRNSKEAGITFIGYDSFSPSNVDVVNNTIYNCLSGGIFLKPSTNGYQNLLIANNIIVGNSYGIQGEDISDVSNLLFKNNLYFSNTTHSRIAGNNYTFQNWKSTFNQDTTGSLAAEPGFSNTIDNTFTLATNSQARDAGVDILNLQDQGTNTSINIGARVTDSEVIGVESGVLENRYTILNPTMTSSRVVSLVDNNRITAGDTTLNLDRYEIGVFPSNSGALAQGVVVKSTGPIDMGSYLDATDMPVHASMQGTQFVMPHTRYRHLYYMVSPHGDATVQVNVDGAQHRVDLSQGVVTEFDAGETNGNVSTVITSDIPILISHKAETDNSNHPYADATPMPPASTELWGIKSRYAYIGAVEDNTHVTIFASNGTMDNITLNRGAKYFVDVGNDNRTQGRGSAIHLVSDKPIGAVQSADGDGYEQTAFFPSSMLSTRLGLPTNAQYIAIVCPESDTNITLYNRNNTPITRRCNATGNYPRRTSFHSTDSETIVTQQGAHIESNKPIYVIYETANEQDEHNLMGTRNP
jgi:parallel beta-helix repeat protein